MNAPTTCPDPEHLLSLRRDFWTWFFNGNCPPAVAATADYISSTVNQMCVLMARCSMWCIADCSDRCCDVAWLVFEGTCLICSCQRRPNLGPRAFTAGWHFDFTVAYVGAGFITPLSVRCAQLSYSTQPVTHQCDTPYQPRLC